MDGFILFVIQEANFCSRVLLVPYVSYVTARENDYKTLKEHAVKNVLDDGFTIPNYLVQNIVRDGNYCTQERHPWTGAVNAVLSRYHGADGDTRADKEWCTNTVIVNSSSFDHVATFRRQVQRDGIVDSFLVMEARDGQVCEPTCKNVNEMYTMFY